MLRDKCHIKKDDKVKVITGKDKGKIGKVLKTVNKKDRILVVLIYAHAKGLDAPLQQKAHEAAQASTEVAPFVHDPINVFPAAGHCPCTDVAVTAEVFGCAVNGYVYPKILRGLIYG